MNVYTARGTPATDKYCFVQSGQVLVQDNELLQSIRTRAANGAVPVHFRTQGEPEHREPRLRELDRAGACPLFDQRGPDRVADPSATPYMSRGLAASTPAGW